MKMILFGDSLLGRFSCGLIRKLETKVAGLEVYNCAAGGMNSVDGVIKASFIASLKSDYVVLSFGANDAAPWKNTTPLEDFQENIQKIIEIFSGSEIIFFMCPPVYDKDDMRGTEEFNSVLSEYNDVVRKVVQQAEATLIDSEKIYSEILSGGDDYHKEDGIHMNADGYDVFMDQIAEILKSDS